MSDDTIQAEFRQALERGSFLIQQCRECGRYGYPPAVRCQHCGEAALKWIAPCGRGVVHSTTVSLERNTGAVPMAVIALEEGPRVLGPVMDVSAQELVIGLAVSAHVGLVDNRHTVVFYNKEQGDKEW